RNTTRRGSFGPGAGRNVAPTTSVRMPAGRSATSVQYDPKHHSSSGWSASVADDVLVEVRDDDVHGLDPMSLEQRAIQGPQSQVFRYFAGEDRADRDA